MATFLQANTILNAWHKAVKEVYLNGATIIDENDTETREILDLIIEIRNPNIQIGEHEFWKTDAIERYCEQLLDSSKGSFSYTYGNRLRSHFISNPLLDPKKIDQIEKVIRRLEKGNNTRKAVAVLFDPTVDHDADDIPCIDLIDFKIRNKKLYLSAYWRSNDIYGAYYANVKGLKYVADFVAEKTNSELKRITTHGGSAHILKYDFVAAEELAMMDKMKK